MRIRQHDARSTASGVGARRRGRRAKPAVAFAAAIAMGVAGVPAVLASPAFAAGTVGQGFTVTTGDLAFILKQIKIAERHTATLSPAHPCDTLVNKVGDAIPDTEQLPDILTAYGLRTVDGTCNNLKPGNEKFAAADVPFPRLTTPNFRDAEPITAALPVGPLGPTSYKQTSGNVVDSQPRVISNLIVDQTSTNPAAVAAAAFPVRAQAGATGIIACTVDPVAGIPPAADTPGVPAGCVPSHQTLFIPNVTTDVGLSPPYNSVFTFFGQFFDHGVDQTVKTGDTVFVPLKADDPLIAGPDHILGNLDDLPANQRFMVLTRAQNGAGPDGLLGTADDVGANNTDTPWVDQSQTYTSHPSHQVFLREYSLVGGKPVATGKLLGGLPAGQTYLNSPDGTAGESTWASVKKQAAEKLGLLLQDKDVTNIPMLAVDPYGKFLPGPVSGLPQYVTATGMVEGNLAAPVPVPANTLHFDTPFLTDIAHNADPSPNPQTGVTPTPDVDNTPSADFANQPANTYDDEMLNAHFACGDGRCNENIALSSIHQIFHSEHNRLADDINTTLTTDTSPTGVAALAQWKALGVSGYGYGERLFQAARYVTEMEYQHTVFEEFARKVQPAVRPFHVYSPDINPAVTAEFAHAVYRFGHSMLDDDVARTNVNPTTGAKSDNSLPLLTAFLNPPELFNGHGAGTLTAQQAAGSIFMGSSDQTGNELDEFVTDTLRNNLLGLPLDLATLNLTRAREAGVPSLNDVRRQIFAATNDGQLAPYTSWSDFGQNLKHPESLINFVAAYGTHSSITGATTLTAKRVAARAIVNPIAGDVPPADAADFMFGTGAYADVAGKTVTGVDNVDLWVGGLAEKTNLFGGLLGSTFNYVFQTQLESLQDGDRLYYLARTPGMNLRTQLEGNSFAELIQRNTDGTDSLKSDAFATADCRFQLANLAGTPAGFAAQGASVTDDPSTPDCNENLLLQRTPNGTIQYKQINSVDPPGINGQSVYNGTSGVDRISGGNDNDTFWGSDGNDVIEGGGGDDVALGGNGNDIITDFAGADVPKGGPGNDAIDAGIGDDIILGGDGQDFLNGGANDNETFAGPGNDYVIAGQGADAVFGDGGDDWIQGGTGQDLLQGDHGAPFFDDPAEPTPGNDIFVGQIGENDYDAEGGDDIMAQNAAVDRNAGAGGFDWAIHQYNTVAADDDMMINNNLGGLPIQVIINRDRWQETEADSGGPLNDVIKGTDGVLSTPRLISGGGFTGCDALDQAGVDRINGLAALLPPSSAWPGTATETAALSASGFCPLTGNVWGEGDILLGGPGSDTITGRTGDEIIDGDKQLRVAITVRDAAGVELGRTDLMEHAATSGTFGPGTTGMTLQQAVFAGLVDPGKLVNVREIVNLQTHPADCGSAAPLNCDTSTYAGPRSQYTIVSNANGSTTVIDTTTVTPAVAGVVAKGDGTDTLFNVERLQFSDVTIPVPPNAGGGGTATTVPGAPAAPAALAGDTNALVTFAPPANTGGGPLTSFEIVVNSGGAVVQTIFPIDPTTSFVAVTGLTNGTTYTFQVRAVNAVGPGPLSAVSNAVTPVGTVIPTVPAAPAIGTPTPGNAQATVRWAAPANGGSPITSYRIQVRTGATVVRTITGIAPGAASSVVTGLTNGTAYNFRVRAVNAIGVGPLSAASIAVTPATVPAAPVIGTAAAGTAGGAITATARWTPAANTGGAPITGFRVTALRLSAAGAVLSTTVSAVQPAAARTLAMTLPARGNYRFTVVSINRVGASAASPRSNLVAGR